MNLLDSNLEGMLPHLYSNRDSSEAIVCARFYAPDDNITWLITEGSPDGGDFEFYGCVVTDIPRWGYFSLSELAGARRDGMRILRDHDFKQTKVRDCIPKELLAKG